MKSIPNRPGATGAILLAFIVVPAACTGDIDGQLGPDAGADTDASPPPVGTTSELYPAERTLSPITPYVAAKLREIAARGAGQNPDVFAKLGDSASVSSSFVHCFDDGYVDPAPGEESGAIDLAGRDHLEAAIRYFRDGDAAGVTPYRRLSRATGVGFTIGDLLTGDPSPMELEYQEIAPLFAIVLVGSSDMGATDIDTFGSALLDLADLSIERGVIPVFNAISPRDDDPALDAEVIHTNAVIRGVAQSRQVPFIDLHREMSALPGRGLGEDGVLPSVYRDLDGQPAPCVFDAPGLEHGYNLRNQLTMEMLARLLATVVQDQDAPDPSTQTLAGAGTAADPFIIESLPFTHTADTSVAGTRAVDTYPGCQAAQDESGPELVYRLDLAQPTRIRAVVVDRGTTDIDVHLLTGGTGGDACVARDHRIVTADLQPGTHHLSLDTFVGSGGELSGEYLLAITQE